MNEVAPFDYSIVPSNAVQSVRDASVRIKVRMSRTAQDIIEIGRDLIAVKRDIGHGNFLPWIEAEFGMSEQSARNYMNVTERFGKSTTVGDFPPTVLYALAAPSTPEPVRQQVIERVQQGETVTASEIRDLKRSYEAKLSDKDEKLRKLTSQKKAVDDHNSNLIDEVRTKSSEVVRFSDEVRLLQEEVRRLTEPGTITVSPASISSGVAYFFEKRPDVMLPDVGPWVAMFDALWDGAPGEAQAAIYRRARALGDQP